jgi:hypothetical protein
MKFFLDPRPVGVLPEEKVARIVSSGPCSSVHRLGYRIGLNELVAPCRTGYSVPAGDLPAQVSAVCAVLECPEESRLLGLAGGDDIRAQGLWRIVVTSWTPFYRRVFSSR